MEIWFRVWFPISREREGKADGGGGVRHSVKAQRRTPAARDTMDVQRFRGGLVFKAHRLLYHSTQGLRVITKKKKSPPAKTRCLTPAQSPTPAALRSRRGSHAGHGGGALSSKYGSQDQVLTLALRSKPLISFELVPLRSDARGALTAAHHIHIYIYIDI